MLLEIREGLAPERVEQAIADALILITIRAPTLTPEPG
jgi:hypothetical protein